MECGAAEIILKAAEFDVSRLRRPKKDPPDCEGMLDGLWSAVELTRHTHQEARAQTQKARKERRAGRKPKTFEAYYEWDREDLLRKIQQIIDRKDQAVSRYKNDYYKRYVLVIHTDEFRLDRANVSAFLKGASFRASQLTDVVLGLSYVPGGYPTFRLPLT